MLVLKWDLEGLFLYAYKQQQKAPNRLYVVPTRKTTRVMPVKRKKTNPIVRLFRLVVVFSFLAAPAVEAPQTKRVRAAWG